MTLGALFNSATYEIESSENFLNYLLWNPNHDWKSSNMIPHLHPSEFNFMELRIQRKSSTMRFSFPWVWSNRLNLFASHHDNSLPKQGFESLSKQKPNVAKEWHFFCKITITYATHLLFLFYCVLNGARCASNNQTYSGTLLCVESKNCSKDQMVQKSKVTNLIWNWTRL